MKYSITINQLAIVQSGYDMDFVDGAVFDFLSDYTNVLSCQKKADNGVIYFNVPYKKVIDELPMSGLKTSDSVYRRFKKLEQYGIIQFHQDNKKIKQVWFAWGRNYEVLKFKKVTGSKSDVATQVDETSDLNPNQTGFKSVLRPDQNPTHNNTNPITSYSSNKLEDNKTPFSEKGKQATITTYTPDQISQTSVTVIEQETVTLETEGFETLEAEKEKEITPIPPAPSFAENQTPNVGKKIKAAKQITADQIAAEMKTPEMIAFFDAISGAWSDWMDYKRREKKGTYKTAQTAAATITALAQKVNYDPAAAREAIEHSIAQTYSGIYPPKNKTDVLVQRYSLQDRPKHASTPDELLNEVRAFYKANTGLLTEAKQYGKVEQLAQNRITEIVTKFCARQVADGRSGDTFEQLNARLQVWFLNEGKVGSQVNDGPKFQETGRDLRPVFYGKR